MKGNDILGLAQTGTGKTQAFGLPIIQAALSRPGKPAPKTVKALILAPTRELVNQISMSLSALKKITKVHVNYVVGGASLGKQLDILSRGTDILVATPGRLIDLLERSGIDLSTTHYLVLDEADQMLDIGFIHAPRRILPYLSRTRQNMLFSATMSKQMENLSETYLTNPKKVQVSPPSVTADQVEQGIQFVQKAQKPFQLIKFLENHKSTATLIFRAPNMAQKD